MGREKSSITADWKKLMEDGADSAYYFLGCAIQYI
jgi:hypothetical protein